MGPNDAAPVTTSPSPQIFLNKKISAILDFMPRSGKGFLSYAAADRERRRRLVKSADNAARNRVIANGIKLRLGCVDCGYSKDSRALQFDHRKQSDKRDIVSQLVKKSTRVMLAEIDKCDVRCAN